MIEEPYRWVEAIANRREYIETQIAGGSPIAALSYRDGILLFTLRRERQKLFERLLDGFIDLHRCRERIAAMPHTLLSEDRRPR